MLVTYSFLMYSGCHNGVNYTRNTEIAAENTEKKKKNYCGLTLGRTLESGERR